MSNSVVGYSNSGSRNSSLTRPPAFTVEAHQQTIRKCITNMHTCLLRAHAVGPGPESCSRAGHYAVRQPSIGDVISDAHYIAERHPIIANA